VTEPEPARVVVLTRAGCHLCEDAVAVVRTVCAETGTTFTERLITEDAELTRRYGDQVPVTFVDGAQHDFWRVDADRLRAALSGRRRRR
jgi:glutaredoxin